MKVAILSESSADEAAIRILLEGILSAKTQGIPSLPLRSRGWPSVIRILPTILKYLHYRTDVESLVVIVDSDDSPFIKAGMTKSVEKTHSVGFANSAMLSLKRHLDSDQLQGEVKSKLLWA